MTGGPISSMDIVRLEGGSELPPLPCSTFALSKIAMKNIAVVCTMTFAGILLVAGCRPEGGRVPAEAPAVSTEQFNAAIESDDLVLVKFGATWCGPCVAVERELEQLEGEWDEGVQLIKVDVDANPGLASQFDVSSIPRLFLMRQGEVLGDRLGYADASELQQWVNAHR